MCLPLTDASGKSAVERCCTLYFVVPLARMVKEIRSAFLSSKVGFPIGYIYIYIQMTLRKNDHDKMICVMTSFNLF